MRFLLGLMIVKLVDIMSWTIEDLNHAQHLTWLEKICFDFDVDDVELLLCHHQHLAASLQASKLCRFDNILAGTGQRVGVGQRGSPHRPWSTQSILAWTDPTWGLGGRRALHIVHGASKRGGKIRKELEERKKQGKMSTFSWNPRYDIAYYGSCLLNWLADFVRLIVNMTGTSSWLIHSIQQSLMSRTMRHKLVDEKKSS